MISEITNNISDLLLDNSIETLPGNIVIGKGKIHNTYIEIRYIYNNNIFLQTLIDDIWSEEEVWGDDNITLGERIIIYICHSDINLEKKELIIDDSLNLSCKFKITTKYFVTINNDLHKYIFPNFLSANHDVISSLQRSKLTISPKISIVTTVYNNAKLLEQTIQSVINQSYNNFEYIIKDACSNDDFLKITEKYRPYISKIISKPDKGIFYGMNEGIQYSSGDYFGILNSDDIYITPHIIEKYLNEINNDPFDAYYANILRRNFNGKSFIRKGNLNNIYRESSINHPTLFLKKNWYEKVGGFDNNLLFAADGELTIKLKKSGCTFKYIDQTMVLFRIGGASTYSWRCFIEEIICRYRYNIFNIKGYLFTLVRGLKYYVLKKK